MGSRMAQRLLTAGYPLTVYNRNAARCAPFTAAGAQAAPTPRAAAGRAEVILSMLADDNASRGLWLGEQGALAGAAPGAILIECSTVSVGWIAELNAAATARGCPLLDAPVLGTKPHAAAGELTFLVGGPAPALETVRPVLAAMSRAVVHFGPTGSGALVKLVNNFLCGVQIASLAEAIGIIERSGLDRTQVLELLNGAAPGSPLLKTISGRMAARDYTPNFALRLMAKDLAYARQEGSLRGVNVETAAAAIAVFQKAISAGRGDEDMSAVVEQFRPS